MRDVLVVGDRNEAMCFERYCLERGTHPTFIMPEAKDIKKVERGGDIDISELLGSHRKQFTDVVCFADDLQLFADIVRKGLKFPFRDTLVIKRICSKSETRSSPKLSRFLPKSIEMSLVESARFAEFTAEIPFPLVVKPSNAFYSAGVTRCNIPSELDAAFSSALRVARLMNARRGTSSILVQEYIDGVEFAVDGFVRDGKIVPILMHQKYPALSGPLFHEYAVITRHLLDEDAETTGLIEFANAVIAASELDDSPFHMELRRTKDRKFVLLELAPRISGGGTTGYNSAKICAGIDMFELLKKVSNCRGEIETISADRNMVCLEYDFAATKPGKLMNLNYIQSKCIELGASAMFNFRKDGDYVRKEGDALGSCLLAYFPCVDWTEAEEKFKYIHENLTVDVACKRP